MGRSGKNLCSNNTVGTSKSRYTVMLWCGAYLEPDTDYIISMKAGETGNRYYTNESLFTSSVSFDAVAGQTVELSCRTVSALSKDNVSQYNTSFNGWAILKNNKAQDNTPAFSEIMIRKADTESGYEPYKGQNITIALGQTVYGGTLDVKTGVLTIDQLGHIFNGAEDITVNNDRFMYYKEGASSTGSNDYNCISSHYPAATNLEVYNNRNTAGYIGICAYSDTLLWNDNINYPTNDVTAYKAYLAAQYAANTPVTAVWKLHTPTTVQLSPAQLMMLKGYNSLSTDGGDVITVTAYVKTT